MLNDFHLEAVEQSSPPSFVIYKRQVYFIIRLPDHFLMEPQNDFQLPRNEKYSK